MSSVSAGKITVFSYDGPNTPPGVSFGPVANGTPSWEKPLNTAREYEEVERLSVNRTIPFTHCWLFPVRTNTLSNFAEDFFFPLFYHGMNKIDFYAQRVIKDIV